MTARIGELIEEPSWPRRFELLAERPELIDRAIGTWCEKQGHAFLGAVIERAAEGVCVCHDIPTFPFVEFTVWNPRMVEITGRQMADVNQTGWYQTVYADPDVQERARQRMARMREGDDLRFERWEIDSPPLGRRHSHLVGWSCC